MKYPYTPPAFLQNQTADVIHRRMLNDLPEDIDTSEAQTTWDFTRPAAMEKAELVEYRLNEVVKLIYPQWSWDEWLDLHGEKVKIFRRTANRAFGYLTVKGVPGTEIFTTDLFATPASRTPSVLFEPTEDAVLEGVKDDEGMVTITIPIRAFLGGKSGNVPKDSIKLMAKPVGGVVYITNDEAITGGTEEETDENLIERILAAMRLGSSFTGCDSDYIRWAKEVSGVGNAYVDPEWVNPKMPPEFRWYDTVSKRWKCAGTVRLFVIDENGLPANDDILDAVYEHIIGEGNDREKEETENNRIKRLSPIGARLTVASPKKHFITVKATVTLRHGEDIKTVTERFTENLVRYYIAAAQNGSSGTLIKYVFVGAALAETVGIENYDHNTFFVNGAKNDIIIPIGEFPVTEEKDIILTDANGGGACGGVVRSGGDTATVGGGIGRGCFAAD